MLTIMPSYWDQYATDAQFPHVINSQNSLARPRSLRQVREIGMTGNVTSKTLASGGKIPRRVCQLLRKRPVDDRFLCEILQPDKLIGLHVNEHENLITDTLPLSMHTWVRYDLMIQNDLHHNMISLTF